MPYNDVSEVPSYVPKAKRKQWLEVWNSAYKEHGDEARAFAEANAAIKKSLDSPMLKFGTALAGYVGPEFGPFKCKTCMFSDAYGDESICTNEFVAEDASVPSDSYGNKLIDPEGCCNQWEPGDEE